MDIFQELKIDLERLDYKTFGSVAPLIAETWNQAMDDLSKNDMQKNAYVDFEIQIPLDYINRANAIVEKKPFSTIDGLFRTGILNWLAELEKNI